MTKDLTPRRRYFIYLMRPDDAIYTTLGEYIYRDYDKCIPHENGDWEIRPGVDQEVPDTYCHLFGTSLANVRE